MSSNGKPNGSAKIEFSELDINSKLDLLHEAIIELVETQAELVEKVSNISLPGSDFDVDEYDT